MSMAGKKHKLNLNNIDKEELKLAAERVENLEDVLGRIWSHYNAYLKKCEDTAKRLLNDILSESSLRFIHSARYRVKEGESLIKKYVKKKAQLPNYAPEFPELITESEKYRNCDDSNYYKVFTDLSGVRILLRYRSEWKEVDKWVRKTFEEKFVHDWNNDFEHAPGKSFLAEKPKVYYKQSEEDYYGQFDVQKFDKIMSKNEYNSIHYVINYNGVYVELQVCTILDEAWGECTHDIIYKGKNSDSELKMWAKCLSEQVKAAETVTELIYSRLNKKSSKLPVKESSNKNADASTSQVPELKKQIFKDMITLLAE